MSHYTVVTHRIKKIKKAFVSQVIKDSQEIPFQFLVHYAIHCKIFINALLEETKF